MYFTLGESNITLDFASFTQWSGYDQKSFPMSTITGNGSAVYMMGELTIVDEIPGLPTQQQPSTTPTVIAIIVAFSIVALTGLFLFLFRQNSLWMEIDIFPVDDFYKKRKSTEMYDQYSIVREKSIFGGVLTLLVACCGTGLVIVYLVEIAQTNVSINQALITSVGLSPVFTDFSLTLVLSGYEQSGCVSADGKCAETLNLNVTGFEAKAGFPTCQYYGEMIRGSEYKFNVETGTFNSDITSRSNDSYLYPGYTNQTCRVYWEGHPSNRVAEGLVTLSSGKDSYYLDLYWKVSSRSYDGEWHTARGFYSSWPGYFFRGDPIRAGLTTVPSMYYKNGRPGSFGVLMNIESRPSGVHVQSPETFDEKVGGEVFSLALEQSPYWLSIDIQPKSSTIQIVAEVFAIFSGLLAIGPIAASIFLKCGKKRLGENESVALSSYDDETSSPQEK
jgi:hypothetical protein